MKTGKTYTSDEVRAHVSPRVQIIQALRVAKYFGGKRPTIKGLQQAFGMSRATAYRWRSAWDYVHE